MRRALADGRLTRPCLGRRPQHRPRRQTAATTADGSLRASAGIGWPSARGGRNAVPGGNRTRAPSAAPAAPSRHRAPCGSPMRCRVRPAELTCLDGDGLLISRGPLGDILEGGSILAREKRDTQGSTPLALHGPCGLLPQRRSPPAPRPPLRPASGCTASGREDDPAGPCTGGDASSCTHVDPHGGQRQERTPSQPREPGRRAHVSTGLRL